MVQIQHSHARPAHPTAKERASPMKHLLSTALITLALTSAAWATKPETPTATPGVKLVNVDEAKQLATTKGAVFVDTRSAVNFGKGRVPGAVSASYKEKSEPTPNFDASLDSFEMAKLPTDKNAKIVFYSDGPTGWKSYKAAVLASKAGYKNVLYMRSGYAEWEAKSLPVER
jgi:3-mercaptopyruvate sulfurtransferase SseA